MSIEDKKKLKRLAIYVAVCTVIVCLIAIIFFRLDVVAAIIKGALSILAPFFYGIVIAYLLRPLCLRIEKLLSKRASPEKKEKKKRLYRAIGILVSMLVLLAFLALLIMAVLPEVIRSISNIISQIPGWLDKFNNWLETLDQSNLSHELVTAIKELVKTISEWVSNFLKNGILPALQTILASLTTSLKGVISFIYNFGLGCIIACYILGSWEKFVKQIRLMNYAIFPKKAADWLREEAHIVNRMFSGFVHGKILDSAIIGGITFIFTMITSMPFAILISVIVGVTNMIPFFGPYIGAIPSAILIFTVSPVKCVVFVIFIIILQNLDGNVIGPKILGDRLGLSGFWILFAILVFGDLWGFVGMLIGAPLFAVIYDLIRRGIYYLLRWRGLSRKKVLESELEKPPEKAVEQK